MPSLQERPTTKPQGKFTAGCLGAILIHPLLFALAFLKGFVLGSAREMVMSATGGSGPTEYLLDGGGNAVGNLAIYYLFIGFIVIPIASLFGAGLSILIEQKFVNKNRQPLGIALGPEVTKRLALIQRFAWVALVVDVILSVHWVAVVSMMSWGITSVLACLQASKVFKPRTFWAVCFVIIGCLAGAMGIELVFFLSEETTFTPTIEFLFHTDSVLWYTRILAVVFVYVRVTQVLLDKRNLNTAASV